MSNSVSSLQWQAQRNRFNHDWLKNKLLLSLDRLVKIADDTIEDDEYANCFVTGGVVDWATEQATARQLIESFEMAMSPQIYLDREPLCRSKYREWLREVVHVLWRSRVGVSSLLATAREKLDAATDAYGELRRCVEGHSSNTECARLACCRRELVAFRDRCRELATAFERFPHRVMVT